MFLYQVCPCLFKERGVEWVRLRELGGVRRVICGARDLAGWVLVWERGGGAGGREGGKWGGRA